MPKLDYSRASSGATRRVSAVDRNITILPGVFDTNRIRNYLGSLLFSIFPGERRSAGRVNVQVLQWRPGRRAVLEIALKADTRWFHLIAKVYCEDRSDVFEALKKVWQSGLNWEAEFSIPYPIAYLPGLHLLLQQKVEGIPAKRVLLDGNAKLRAEAAERCALWLARFQALAPLQGKVRRVQEVLNRSEHRLRRIVDARAPFADKAERLFQRLADTSSGVEEKPLCAGHGDFTHNQVILSEKAVVTCDWDAYDVADPCRDVARFLVCLERLALKEPSAARGLEHACRRFLSSYLAADTSGVESRLPFYKAVFYLQVAKNDGVSQEPSSLRRVETLLNRGLQTLARQ